MRLLVQIESRRVGLTRQQESLNAARRLSPGDVARHIREIANPTAAYDQSDITAIQAERKRRQDLNIRLPEDTTV